VRSLRGSDHASHSRDKSLKKHKMAGAFQAAAVNPFLWGLA
jgi:hypothetical protein